MSNDRIAKGSCLTGRIDLSVGLFENVVQMRASWRLEGGNSRERVRIRIMKGEAFRTMDSTGQTLIGPIKSLSNKMGELPTLSLGTSARLLKNVRHRSPNSYLTC